MHSSSRAVRGSRRCWPHSRTPHPSNPSDGRLLWHTGWDERFGPAHTPAWIDSPAGIYGIPEHRGRRVKVGIDEHGPPIDPDTDDRIACIRDDRSRACEWLARRFPAMEGAPVIETRVCQYENTSTAILLIDRHPGL